jgi:protein gp37
MNRSTIPWTQYTWNVTTGCAKVSRGCANCYAERVSASL